MGNIGETIQMKKETVNGKLKYTPTVNSNEDFISTVNSNSISGKIDQFLEDLKLEPECLAEELARKLGDIKSLPYYVILVKNSNQGKLFEALSFTLDADRRGAIRESKPIYFLAILNRWGIKTKFKTSHE